jgi:small basic protein
VQVIVVAILFALIGIALGLMSPLTIPITYARYTAVALLAALDSIFGAFKAYIAGTFEPRVFFSGLLTNMTLAAGLTYFGDKLGVDLSIAAIVAFGSGFSITLVRFGGIICKRRYHSGTQVLAPTVR